MQENTGDIHTLVKAFKSISNLFLTIRYRKIPSDTTRNISYYIAATYNATNGFASESQPVQTFKLIQGRKKPKDLEKTEQDIHNLIVSWWTKTLKESANPELD